MLELIGGEFYIDLCLVPRLCSLFSLTALVLVATTASACFSFTMRRFCLSSSGASFILLCVLHVILSKTVWRRTLTLLLTLLHQISLRAAAVAKFSRANAREKAESRRIVSPRSSLLIRAGPGCLN